jgi:hypothetical protein
MKTGLDPLGKKFRGLRCVMCILAMCICLHLVPYMHRRAKAGQVPAGLFETWKLPAVIPKVIRTYPLEEFTIGQDRAEPWLARKQKLERILKHPHVHRGDHVRKLFEWHLGQVRDLV